MLFDFIWGAFPLFFTLQVINKLSSLSFLEDVLGVLGNLSLLSNLN